MNKLFFCLILSIMAFVPQTHSQVKINGDIKFQDQVQMVYLSYRTPDGQIRDSSKPTNGKFQFTEKIVEPTLANLTVSFAPVAGQAKPRVEGMQLFLEPGKIKIEAKDSLKFAKVKGSKSHREFKVFNDRLKPYNDNARALSIQYKEYSDKKDEVGMKKIQAEFDKLSTEKNENVIRKYISDNTTSPIALHVLKQYAGFDIDVPKIELLYQSLPASVHASPSGIAFKEQIEIARKTMVGAYAMDFTQNDTLGIPVSLSSFKGKYVLIDFWASWCGPCRKENPNVVKAFNAYNKKGFTVLGISLDQPGKQQAWMDAIHKDELTWTHVSDLKFWDNAVAKQYNIRAIPQNLLLDPTGKIIARNIKGEELAKKLAEVFPN